jgi:serine/threonine protein kinase
MMSIPCPSPDRLREYLSGSLDGAAIDAISEHIETCKDCLTQLSEQALPGWAVPEMAVPDDSAFRVAVDQLLKLAVEPVPAIGPGSVLRDYRILETLGEGGMGTVYLAKHERLDKTVAVKVIRDGAWSRPQARARFEREMKAVGRLNDDRIVRATDAGEAANVPFLAMEYIDGQTLAEAVKTDGPFPVEHARAIVREIALGLQHAHEAGLVHRDIKPGNIMLTRDGQVKILDLGLAAIHEADPANDAAATVELASDLTSPSRMLGTRDYMAPEQRINAHTVDARADVYGLGGVLWFILTGQPPHRGQPPAAIPKAIWQRLLAEDPEDRFATADNVASALAEPSPRLWNRFLIFAMAGLAVGILTVLIWPSRPQDTVTPHAGEASPVPPLLPPRPKPSPGQLPMTAKQVQAMQRDWADWLGVTVSAVDALQMEMILIPPGGPFTASPGVTMELTRPYYIGATEVTVDQFRIFVATSKPRYKTTVEISGKGTLIFGDPNKLNRSRTDPGLTFDSPGYPIAGHLPVTQVSFEDGVAFCAWLSQKSGKRYRLPTIAEWKWAARAGTTSRYYTGDDFDELLNYEWLRPNANMTPQRVATRKPNPFGVFDMYGNVCEWADGRTKDVRRPPGHYIDPQAELTSDFTTQCGGYYASTATSPDPPVGADTAWRIGVRVGWSLAGFRVVREIDEPAGSP